MVSETGIKVLIKEIQRLKEQNTELQLKLGKQERDAFFKKGGKITPIRIVHLAEKTAMVDYVNNRVIFESWQGYASFSVDLNKFDYIFIPNCQELKWGAFCFVKKEELNSFNENSIGKLKHFVFENSRKSVSSDEIKKYTGNEIVLDLGNIYVESALKDEQFISMFSILTESDF